MKKLYLFFLLPFFGLNAQIEGMWRLAPAAGSLAVGPAQGSSQWWANGAADVNTRACLFDDSVKFEANGTMTHYMNNSTWLEGWQGASPEACGAPVTPHVGGAFTYSYTGGALTINGIGGHIGLPKAYNGGELNATSTVPASRTYIITFSNNNNTMTADIEVNGGNWWRFVYQRTNAVTIPNPNITFRVNMSNYTGSLANGVFVNGTFNNWCGGCNPLTDIGNGVWQATLPIPAGNIEYKFTVNGWADQEMFASTSPCIDPINDGNNNRYYTISSDATLPPVCFESCDPCPSNTTQIEGMWRLAPAAGSLAVGPAQGSGAYWANGSAEVISRACLFDDSVKFEANGTMTHYMDNSTWVEGWQGLPDACNAPVAPHVGGAFTYTYGGGALTINGIGGHIGLPKAYNGGELNATSTVPASRTYIITFSSNSDTMKADIEVGGGTWWRFVYVKTNAVIIPAPNITFRVNMSNYTGSLANGVFVNGSFNNWCGTCNPLTDGGNGVWQATLPIPAGNIEYKYTVNGWAVQEMFASTSPCIDPINDGNNNRYYEITNDAVLPVVCFESCDACVSPPPAQLIGNWKLKASAGALGVGPGQGNTAWWANDLAAVTTRACLFDDSVKFEANGTMTHFMDGGTWLEGWQGVNPDACGAPVAPHVGGAFTYSYSGGELSINGIGGHLGLAKAYNGNELTATATVPTSRTYQITFSSNGDTMTADIAINNGGWWRFVYVKTQIFQAPTPVVTFKVDMNNYAGITPTNVSVFGNFNGWNPNANPMTDANTDGIWETSLPIAAGPIEYKFFINNSNVEEQFVGGEPCTVTFIDNNNDVFVNRSYTVVGDADLDTVCFESCNACISGINEQAGMTLKLMPNPAQTSFNIVSSEVITEVELFDLSGKSVRKVTGSTTELNVNVADLVQGMYTVIVRSENGTTTSRVIVE